MQAAGAPPRDAVGRGPAENATDMNKRMLAIMAVTVVTVAAILAVLGWSAWPDPDPQHSEASDSQMVERGATIYQQHCASCHGVNLEGQEGWQQRQPDGTLLAPPHDGSGHTWHHSDDMLFRITKFGTDAVVPGPHKSAMIGFADILSDEEIWAALAYIKSRWPQEIREAHQTRQGGGSHSDESDASGTPGDSGHSGH